MMRTRHLFLLLAGLLATLSACGGGQQSTGTSTSSAFLSSGAEDRYRQGMESWRAGDTVLAERQFREALGDNPRYLAAHIALADLLREEDRPDEAVDAYTDAIALRPDSIDANLGRARAHAALQRLEEAERDAAKAERAAEASGNRLLQAQTSAVRARIYEAQGMTDEAITAYERALELDASVTEARIGLAYLYAERERVTDAVRVLSRAVQYESGADVLLEVGRTFHALEAFDRAFETLEIAFESAPRNDEIAYLYASSAVRTGRDDLGVAIASDLIARSPEVLPAYVVRGEANLRRGYVPSARSDATTVLNERPEDYDALVLLGDVERADRNLDAAQRAYERAIRARPEQLRGVEHLGRLLYERQDWAAFTALVTPYADRADRPSAWNQMLVDALLWQDRDPEAIRIKSDMADENPSDHALHHEVAAMALQHSDALPPEKVLEHAEWAVEYIGGAPLAYRLTLIDALLLNGRQSEARDVIRQAETLFPNSTELRARRERLR